jgi:hypothetical protein
LECAGCYSEGKRCAETLFFDYRRQYDLEIKVVRIFNTYGPRMYPDDGRVVSNFIAQALRGQDVTLYGDGQPDPLVLLRGRFGRCHAGRDGYADRISPARSTWRGDRARCQSPTALAVRCEST